MSPNDIVLCAPVRTPIGKFSGVLSSLSAADLGTAAARACLERSGISGGSIDQTIFGHGRQAGGGPNTARQISYRAGVPVESPAFTVNQACGSGLQAVLSAARTIRLGEAEVILVGGTESMSNTPYFLPRARTGYRLGHAEIVDGMYKDGFDDPLSKLVMGETAEELRRRRGSGERRPTPGRSKARPAANARGKPAGSPPRSRRSPYRGRKGRSSFQPTSTRATARRSNRSRSCRPCFAKGAR